MAEKIIKINDKEIKFKATAGTPRLYRNMFGTDMMVDMQKLQMQGEEIKSLEIMENLAYIMAKHGDPTITNDTVEWLDQFETMEVYEMLPSIVELWKINMKNDVIPSIKKKTKTN